MKVSYKLISTLRASKVPIRWHCHYCCVWSSILKVLKVISLQYLYNISKKKLRREFIFLHADEHQSFYKLRLFFFMEVARYVQSTQNRKLVIFLSYFFVLLWYKTFKCFTGVQPYLMFIVSQTRHFLPDNLNIIIKQPLCGEGFPSLFPLLQDDVFQ